MTRIEEIRNEFTESIQTGIPHLFPVSLDISNTLFIEILKQGNWSLIPILKQQGTNLLYCLRIIPWLPIEQWSIVQLNPDTNAKITLGKQKNNFIPSLMYFFGGIRFSENYQLELRRKLPELERLIRSLAGMLKNEVLNDEILTLVSGEIIDNLTVRDQYDLTFILASDSSNENKMLRREIEAVKSNHNHISTSWKYDYGYLNSFAYNFFTNQANKNIFEVDWNTAIDITWESFFQISFFDAVSYEVTQLPSMSENCRYAVSQAAGSFFLENDGDYVVPKHMREHPLYMVIQAIEEAGYDGYVGTEHLMLAAHFDMEEDSPIYAWNALVNCGYWCAENAGVTSLGALEAAIFISEKNNWVDAHAVLVEYLDLYNKYLT